MEISLTEDKSGVHLVDHESGYGLFFPDRESALKVAQSDMMTGNKNEAALLEVLRSVVAKYPELDEPLDKQVFSITAPEAVTSWPP